jgi:hypothetical protein
MVTSNQALRLLFINTPPKEVKFGDYFSIKICIVNEIGLWNRSLMNNKKNDNCDKSSVVNFEKKQNFGDENIILNKNKNVENNMDDDDNCKLFCDIIYFDKTLQEKKPFSIQFLNEKNYSNFNDNTKIKNNFLNKNFAEIGIDGKIFSNYFLFYIFFIFLFIFEN